MNRSSSLPIAALVVLGGMSAAQAQDRDWGYASQGTGWQQDGSGYRDRNPSRMAQSDYERGYNDAYRRFRQEYGGGGLEGQDQSSPGGRGQYRFGYQHDWAEQPSEQSYGGQAPVRGQSRSRSSASDGSVSDQEQGSASASSRAAQDVADIRRQLNQAGFQQIRILDTTYLVQAITPNGRSVVMIVDPPRAGSGASSSSRDRLSGEQPSFRSDNAGSGSDAGPGSRVLPGLSQNAVRSKLEDRGFGEISDLHRDGSTFVGTGDWYGDQVDFRVDGRNGYIIEPSHITQKQIRTKLDQDGWTDVADLRDVGPNYRVKASRNGSTYDLLIDARTGEITSRVAQGGSDTDQQTTGSMGNNKSAPALAHEKIPGQSKTSKILGGAGEQPAAEGTDPSGQSSQ